MNADLFTSVPEFDFACVVCWWMVWVETKCVPTDITLPSDAKQAQSPNKVGERGGTDEVGCVSVQGLRLGISDGSGVVFIWAMTCKGGPQYKGLT